MAVFARIVAPLVVACGLLASPAAWASGAPLPESRATDLWRQGHEAAEHGSLTEAVGFYTASLKVDPRGRDALVDLATALSDLGRWDDARKAYERAVTAFPDDAAALNGLGYVHYRQERFELAIHCFQRALARMEDPQFHVNLGLALLSQDRYGQAEDEFRRVLSLEPGHYWATNNLGWVFQLEGRTGDALAAYARALKLNPSGITTHMNFGKLLLDEQDFDSAVTVFTDALKKDDTASEAHLGLAVALERLNRVEEARREALVAWRLQPGYLNAQAAYARLLDATGEPDRAVATMREVIRQAPDQSDDRLWLARTLERRGRNEEAIAAYQAYLSVAEDDPELPDARMHLRLLQAR